MARVTTKQSLAARKSWQERAETWRDKINTAKIIGRLEDFVSGVKAPEGFVVLPDEPTQAMLDAAGITQEQYTALKEKAPDPMPVEMSPAQVKSAQVLLDRVMPTLSASEVTHKEEKTSPEQLVQMLKERYGEEFVKQISKDYLPNQEEVKH